MASFATHFYFSPRGRTGRALYWMFGVLPFFLAGILLGLLAGIFRLPEEAVLFMSGIITLSGLWTWICVSSRRLHDFNQSAWWLLLAFALPFAILLVAPISVAQLSSLIVLVVLGVIPGTPGGNRFGADPNARRPNAASELRSN